jgi:L-fucose isomerase-like protein
MLKPKIGVCTVVMKGFNLGEDACVGYQKDLIKGCEKLGFETIVAPDFISSPEIAEETALFFSDKDLDTYILHIGTFTDDARVMPLITNLKKPVIVWAHDYSAFNISITGSQNVIPNIYDLGLDYKFIYGKFDDKEAFGKLYKYARACALKNMLGKLKIGYFGGHPSIMTNLTIDEIAIQGIFGISLINFGNEDLIIGSGSIKKEESNELWAEIKSLAGKIDARDDLGILSSSMLAYILKLVKENSLGAVSINCFPHLKGKVCLPIARLNDLGIPAACEGDLNSTILMYMLYHLSGRTVSNGDQLKIYNLDKKNNSMMFSHCGAGAFTLAKEKRDIRISADFETGTGIAVYFPERIPGEVTMANMMGSRAGYRMFIAKGKALDVDLIKDYEGNPINIQFDFDIRNMLERIAEGGFGHHWNIGYGDYVGELIQLCSLLGIEYDLMSEQ